MSYLHGQTGLTLTQGEAAAQAQSWSEAEGFFLRAKQPELALAMYRKARLWDEALRIADDYLPAKVIDINCVHHSTPMQTNWSKTLCIIPQYAARARALLYQGC